MESVWDYPRPPRVEPSRRRVRVEGIADSTRALRVLETSHPPTVYVPPADVRTELLSPSRARGSVCEWKGRAVYWDVGEKRGAAWSYPSPTPAFGALRDHLAFYPSLFACFLDDERVRAQEGDFYGGWLTEDLVGPFKGGPGTLGW